MKLRDMQGRLRPQLPALIPGGILVALMLVWCVADGGYDSITWLWGALVSLSIVTCVVGLRLANHHLTRASRIAVACLALYVAWSYLSIAWAAYPGDALQGSNRALLYLLVFVGMLVLPWTVEAALVALGTFVSGVGVIAIVLLTRLASSDHVGGLIIEGRLAAPTGYFNSTAALFTIGALGGAGLATVRRLPGLLRGFLLACATASLQLAVVVQSRGWLFTLPLILMLAVVVVPNRIRLLVAAAVPAAVVLVTLHRLLAVYHDGQGTALAHAAAKAGQAGLLACFATLFVGTLLAWGDGLMTPRSLRHPRVVGRIAVAVTALAVAGGGIAATHGHPLPFVKRQWNGFSHVQHADARGSHFGDVGSGRYDFWRVSLDAFSAHPVGGLGQDNFGDYYVVHRRTREEPSWTHSLEMRLLAHTGLVGLLLFAGFVAGALFAGLRRAARASAPGARELAAVALLPFLVWAIHGSVDWFWEFPALTGPALGFLGMAIALRESGSRSSAEARTDRRFPAAASVAVGVLAAAAGSLVLGLPYLSQRETARATSEQTRNPAAALADLHKAAVLNPLNAEPVRLAGAIALRSGLPNVAEVRFRQTVDREPGGWFGWFGAGLAESALGNIPAARRDLLHAARINSRQSAVTEALARVGTQRPLSPAEALRLLVLVH